MIALGLMCLVVGGVLTWVRVASDGEPALRA